MADAAKDDAPTAESTARARLRLSLHFGEAGMIGPGKADLLELIRDTGSIAAAGKAMGMSYKRAWTLVETLNALFASPLVIRSRGGATGGGARLTETGAEVLAHYRALEAAALTSGAREIAALEALRAPLAEEATGED